MKTLHASLFLTALLCLYPAPALTGAKPAADLWQRNASDDVKWMKVTFAGGFLYGCDSGIYSLDPATGQIVWNNQANADRRRTTEQWEKAVSKRFSKTNATGNYSYMLADVKTAEGKGPGIAGINLDTGEADRTILFGDREPEYVVDEISGIVYRTHKSGKIISAAQIR